MSSTTASSRKECDSTTKSLSQKSILLFLRHALSFPLQQRRSDPAIRNTLDQLPLSLREMAEHILLGDWDDGLFQSNEDPSKVFSDIVNWFN